MDASKQPTRVEPAKSRGGEWVTFGDEQYRVPPVAFRALQELGDEITGLKDLTGKPSAEQMKTIEKIVHSALKRNYPELTLNDVSDMLDIGNFMDVLNACLSVAGFKRAGAAAPGETAASIGTGSTPS